jgi:hypothetical protein
MRTTFLGRPMSKSFEYELHLPAEVQPGFEASS